jgi:hypothetical protein
MNFWKKVLSVCLLAATACVVGCTGARTPNHGLKTEDQVRMAMGYLEIGMPKANVLDILGPAWCSETVNSMEYLIYRTGCGPAPDGRRYMLPECFTPVGLSSGQVAGWGIRFYEQATGEEFLGCGYYRRRD